VQGLTISHHKAFGIVVSGEVICYSPQLRILPTATPVDSRIVFETWLFQAFYPPRALLETRAYCIANAMRLRRSLAALGLATRYNDACLITLLEHIPPWLVRAFHLAPEGDWVHFIAMPHIAPSAIAHFAAALLRVSMHFTATFRALHAQLSIAFGCPVELKRVRMQDDSLFANLLAMAERMHDGHKGQFDVTAFKRRYVYSAVSYAAVNEAGELLAVFLAEADADRCITPGPLLVDANNKVDRRLLKDTRLRGFDILTQRLELNACTVEVH
jgi:hypothetical protein